MSFTITGLLEANNPLAQQLHTPLYFGIDPLVLTCVSYRIWKESAEIIRFKELSECIEFAKDEDFFRAHEMATYYRDKIGFFALQGKKLTAFQTDLYGILTTEEITTKHERMLYKLPYLYQEDLDNIELNNRWKDVKLEDSEKITTKRLTPVKRLFYSRNGNEMVYFWFEDENQNPVLWSVKNSDGLRNLVEQLFKLSSISIIGLYRQVQMRNMNFMHYIVIKPELAITPDRKLV